MNKTLQGVVISLFFAGLVIGLHYLIFFLLRNNGSFDLKEIRIEGNKNISRNEIIHASGLQSGMYIFSINLPQTANNITRLEMIKSASVRRLPPDSVSISVTEREISALVQSPGRTVYCDADGFIVTQGAVPEATRITADFTIQVERGRIQEETVRVTLANLSRFEHKDLVSQIVLRQKEGVYIFLKGQDTTFFLGNKLPSLDLLNLVYSLGKTIKERRLKIKYVDVNKENPIGY